jgi:predicted ATPase
VTARRFPPP